MVSNFEKWTHNTSHPRAQYCQVSRELVAENEGVSLSNQKIIGWHCVISRSVKNAVQCTALPSTYIDKGDLGYRLDCTLS